MSNPLTEQEAMSQMAHVRAIVRSWQNLVATPMDDTADEGADDAE